MQHKLKENIMVLVQIMQLAFLKTYQ